MKKIKIMLSIALLLCVSYAIAQDSPVPPDYKLTKNEDYKTYEKDILNTIDYLENTPVNTNRKQRMEAAKFLLEWTTGSPDVTIALSQSILVFTDRNPDLQTVFIAGWTRYAIQHPEDKSDVKGNVAGLKSVIKVYKMGNGMKDDDKVNKLVKVNDKGELEKWVKEQLSKDAIKK